MAGTDIARIELQQQPDDEPYLFQKGHPRYGGRRKGSRNRFGGDLREEIVAAIQETGFIQKDEKGELVGTGKDGCKGFIKWLALHEPKTAAALFARVLPSGAYGAALWPQYTWDESHEAFEQLVAEGAIDLSLASE